jgi:hypothetical protein
VEWVWLVVVVSRIGADGPIGCGTGVLSR